MACTVLSEDILAVCLLLAEGDLRMPLEAVIRRAEEAPADPLRHFGIAPDEWRGLFLFLFWPDPEATNLAQRRSDRALASVVPLVLAYGGAHLNDEGECWGTAEEIAAQADWSLGWPWQEANDILSPDDRQMRLALRQFLQRQDLESLSPDCVQRFMQAEGIGQGTLTAQLQPSAGPVEHETGEP